MSSFLDLSKFSNKTLRQYELEIFSLPVKFATKKEVYQFTGKGYGKVGETLWRLRRKINKKKKVFVDPSFQFSDELLEVKPPAFLKGYWQSEKYFKKYSNLILSDFRFPNIDGRKNNELAKKIISCTSASIHIRRGDYVSNEKTNNYHGTCSLGYYKKAIEYLGKKVREIEYFIFSDDIKWCEENFSFLQPTYIDWNQGKNAFRDMQLMSLCKHNIIANSSFSWWGAWLNQNPGKIVIVPLRWFANQQMNQLIDDLIPEEWIKL